jgi:osmotically-inducible protein OsmY
VFSDAHLVALVRSALGRDPKVRDLPARLNISSCGFVVTLHGLVPTREDARRVEAAVRRVQGVQSVENKLEVAP